MCQRRLRHTHFGVLSAAPGADPSPGRGRTHCLSGAALTAEGLRCGEGEETVVLLLSESSQGSSSVHEVHVPQGRGRQRRQAASSPSTSPGRVLPGFHKASEVLTEISWLLLPIPSSASAQRKVARRYRSYSTYGRAASLVEAESDGWATAGRLRCANNSFAKHISRLAVHFVVHLLGQAAARWPDRLYGLGSIGSHDFTDNSFTIRWGSDI